MLTFYTSFVIFGVDARKTSSYAIFVSEHDYNGYERVFARIYFE